MSSMASAVSVRSRQSEASAYITEGLWDEDDLIARLGGALDYAACALKELGACEDDAERPAHAQGEKLITQTARLLLAASNVGSYAAIGPRILRVATLLAPHARSARMLRAVCLEPALALEHATAHICLNRLHLYDADFDAAVDMSMAAHASGGRERVPHRMLEQDWLRQGWVFPEGLTKLKAGPQMASCALNRTMDLLAGSRDDVQSFTRALMCLRDLNLFPRPLPRPRETLLAEAEGMLARCLEQEDHALAAEVLLAWPLTGETWSAAAAFTFRVVMYARDTRSGSFATDSQAIYALGILSAACLAPGRRPPVHLPGQAPRTGAFATVFNAVDLEGMPSAWIQELAKLQTPERQALVEFVLAIGLHREFRRREFRAMERLLAIGNDLGLGTSPLACQAAEMITRLVSCGLAGSTMVTPSNAQSSAVEASTQAEDLVPVF